MFMIDIWKGANPVAEGYLIAETETELFRVLEEAFSINPETGESIDGTTPYHIVNFHPETGKIWVREGSKEELTEAVNADARLLETFYDNEAQVLGAVLLANKAFGDMFKD